MSRPLKKKPQRGKPGRRSLSTRLTIPPAHILPYVCKQGVLFRMTMTLRGKTSPRYLIVANRNPMKDKEVLLLTTTTKLHAPWLRSRPPKTVVSVPANRDPFPRNSAIDCNDPFPLSLGKLAANIETDSAFEVISEVPQKLLIDIIAAVRRSPIVTPRMKKRICGEELKPKRPTS